MKQFIPLYCLLLLVHSTNAQVIIDGFFDDWNDESIVVVEESNFDSEGTELEGLSITNDSEYLYLRITLNEEVDLVDEDPLASLRIFIDADSDPNTGYPASENFGSEFGVDFQNRLIYNDENFPEFYEMSLYSMGIVAMPTITSKEFEIMISRDLLSDEIGLLIREEISGDEIPNQGSLLTYQFYEDYSTIEDVSIAKEPNVDLRLLAYNLQHNLFDNQEEFSRIINALDPDVISFSEVSEVSVDQMLSFFDEYIDYPQWYAHKNGDVMAVSKYPFIEFWSVTSKIGASLIDLPETEFDKDFLTLYAHPPCCGNDAGRQFHFDKFIEFILDIQEEGGVGVVPENTPFAFSGDMNLVGLRQQYNTIVNGSISNTAEFGEGGFPDWDNSPLGDAICRITTHTSAHTWRANTANPAVGEYAPGRLDFIFYSNSVITLAKSFTLDTHNLNYGTLNQWGLEYDDTYSTSDHLPIVSDFILNEENVNPEEVLGCTYPSAINFSNSATLDDGSCEFESCDSAYESGYEQGQIDASESNNCPGDLTNDLIVSTQDLLELLTLFGNQCE